MSLLILFPGASSGGGGEPGADSPYFDGDYFLETYFDTDGNGSTPSTGGGSPGKRRVSMQLQPPAAVEITDDGWIHILL